MKIHPDHDPMGHAVRDYFEQGRAGRLLVRSSLFEEDEMPVETLFRRPESMPPLERLALERCEGRVLDVGAGAGCHALALQERGFEVTALDVSPLCVETMRRRGVKDAREGDFFEMQFDRPFETVLFLMNGLGIAGSLARLPLFFARLSEILADGGRVLADSSDLSYVFMDEDGAFSPDDFDDYYGQVDYLMQYGRVRGTRFDWLYIDFDTLRAEAERCGFRAELLRRGDHFDYIAELRRA